MTPAVDACARCAVPNASITKRFAGARHAAGRGPPGSRSLRRGSARSPRAPDRLARGRRSGRPVRGERHRPAQHVAEGRRDRGHGEGRVEAGRPRPPQVGDDGHCRTGRERLLQGRGGCPDASRVGDPAVRERHVEVRAHEHAPAPRGRGPPCARTRGRAVPAAGGSFAEARSGIHERHRGIEHPVGRSPHSLSYHASTFTCRPAEHLGEGAPRRSRGGRGGG